jgi:hypothetical protein
VGTYLQFILTGFSKNAKSRRHTSLGILVNYTKAFLGGYLHIHLILTGFSKTAKRSRHTSTGFLVDYAEGSLRGYLPTFYINWIIKNHQMLG